MVRDRLWEKACLRSEDGGCLMIWTSDNEQGYRIDTWGETSRLVEDFEGLSLIRMP